MPIEMSHVDFPLGSEVKVACSFSNGSILPTDVGLLDVDATSGEIRYTVEKLATFKERARVKTT